MTLSSIAAPLLGGILIGVATSLLLLFNGRVLGVSGILSGALLSPQPSERTWRFASLLGFLAAGLFILVFHSETLVANQGSLGRYAVAGLLVGFGTQLGSGCTSGHGVCGISRLSRRSILATLTFMISGMMTVAVMRFAGVLP